VARMIRSIEKTEKGKKLGNNNLLQGNYFFNCVRVNW
jgi:hypothetical protein